MKLIYEKIKKSDLKLIQNQLPAGKTRAFGVVHRCDHGVPSILLLHPLNKNGSINHTSIATPLWLSCPYLNKKIHKIEDSGYVSKISEFIRDDRILRANMNDAHANYYFIRKELFRLASDKSFQDADLTHFNKGIGGSADLYYAKCLHLHYAHYFFCHLNIVGKIVGNLLENDFCCKNRECLKK
jgi:uncharacterized protein